MHESIVFYSTCAMSSYRKFMLFAISSPDEFLVSCCWRCHYCLCQEYYVYPACVFLSVCLPVSNFLHKNCKSDLHENFIVHVSLDTADQLDFGSHPNPDYRIRLWIWMTGFALAVVWALWVLLLLLLLLLLILLLFLTPIRTKPVGVNIEVKQM